MRLFVAAELPRAVRAALGAIAHPLAEDEWRPTPEENLHVTLAFLGERRDDEVEAISRLISKAVAGRSPLTGIRTGEVLMLPPRRPRVAAVEIVDPGCHLQALQGAISAGLQAAGLFEPESRPFLAHTTVARRRGSSQGRPRSRAVDQPTRLAAPVCEAFALEHIALMRSRPSAAGSRYEALSRIPLGS